MSDPIDPVRRRMLIALGELSAAAVLAGCVPPMKAGARAQASIDPRASVHIDFLKFLMEQETPRALPILLDTVVREPDANMRALELRLIGLHRRADTADLLSKFLIHPDSTTRAAAVDAIGLLHAPAFPVPLNEYGMENIDAAIISDGHIDLTALLMNKNGSHLESALDVTPIPLPTALRDAIVRIAATGPTTEEREAAARALLRWQPEKYFLRIAEWGVWIDDGGELKLIKSVLDEIPAFVHRTGNPLSEFKNRVNHVMIVTKPILHITTDQLLAVDLQITIRRGRPWFAYPKPDDFSLEAYQPVYEIKRLPDGRHQRTPYVPLLAPLENPALGELKDVREGYPWVTPSHRRVGSITGGGRDVDSRTNEFESMGCRWQSLIVSPERLSWMLPPDVGEDPRFHWWRVLREVPCSWVSSRGESERFIYYDGPTRAPAPMRIAREGQALRFTFTRSADFFFGILSSNETGDWGENNDPNTRESPDVHFTHQPPDQARRGLFIRVAAGKASGQVIAIPPRLTSDEHDVVDVPLANADPLHDEQVEQALHTILTAGGLKSDEADGLIKCWRPQFFQTDGMRFLLVLCARDYDLFCPILMRPRPTELARVGIVLTELSAG